jgi:tetratricopeptide (TPR) repeat protein
MTLENLTPEQLDATAAALQASGRFDEYLEMTEALVALYPQRADVHLHRARALGFGAGRRAEALREVEVATRLVREEPQDLMRLAAVLLAFDLIEGVDEYVERAVRAAGLDSAADEPSLPYLAGVAASARGEDPAAQTLLEAAVTGDPREPDYVRDLARLYVRIGQTDRARAVATRALEASPRDERLRRLASSVPAEAHADPWRAAVAEVLDGQADGLLCPVYGDGELVWTPAVSRVAGERIYRLYCPMCGAEVEVNVEAPGAV